MKDIDSSYTFSYSSSAVTEDGSPRNHRNYSLPCYLQFDTIDLQISKLIESSVQDNDSPTKTEKVQKKKPSRRMKAKKKTELCKSWIETGHCQYDSECKFAHGDHELRAKPETSLRNYKTIKCQKFHENMFCPYGSRCKYIHQSQEIDFTSKHRNYFFHFSSDSKGTMDEEVTAFLSISENLHSYHSISPSKVPEILQISESQ